MNDFSDFKEIKGNLVHPSAIVYWDRISIGTGNIIYPYVCIGTDAQHLKQPSSGIIEIGDNNIFREHVTVNCATPISNLTKIGSNCYFMISSHIAHDCVIEDNVTMGNNTTLAGHVHVMNYAVLGLNCNIHQFQVIGSYSMLGMGTIVSAKRTIYPGKVYVGSNAKFAKENTIGLERNNITPEVLEKEKTRFENLYKVNH